MTFKSQQISISINCPADKVYACASNPENLPQWASGLSGSIKRVGNNWIADSHIGKIKIKFTEKNNFGILDHDVTLPSGEIIYNPMRVFPNENGSEVVFTLYHRPGMSDKLIAEDATLIKHDLEKLKRLLEK